MAEEVVRAARNVDRALIERVDIFDLYEGKGVPEGKKSLAIAVRLQPKDKHAHRRRDRDSRTEDRGGRDQSDRRDAARLAPPQSRHESA